VWALLAEQAIGMFTGAAIVVNKACGRRGGDGEPCSGFFFMTMLRSGVWGGGV
jgi:hypothetical protein